MDNGLDTTDIQDISALLLNSSTENQINFNTGKN
jgi:hypothetical protein